MINIISLLTAFLALYSSPQVQGNPAILAQVNALEPQVMALASQAIQTQMDIPAPSSTVVVSVPSSTVETSTPIVVDVPPPMQQTQVTAAQGQVFSAAPATPAIPILPQFQEAVNGSSTALFVFAANTGDYDSLFVTVSSGGWNRDWTGSATYPFSSSDCQGKWSQNAWDCMEVSGLSPSTNYWFFFTATKQGVSASSSVHSVFTCSARYDGGGDDGTC